LKIRGNQLSAMLTKLGSIVGALALSAALLLASSRPGHGTYEVNVYEAYPSPFWILVSVALSLGFMSVFSEIFSMHSPYGWVYGFLLIVLVNSLILSLPCLRDYAFTNQWDDVVHFSLAMNIVEYGQPDSQNFYPTSHLLATAFSQITGLDLQVVISLFPMFFYLVHLANTAFVAWSMDTRSGVRALMMTLASPLVFHTYSTTFRPTHFSVCMFPLVVGWIYRTRFQRLRWLDSIPFVLLLIFLPFFHPWSVVSAIGISLAFGIAFALEPTKRLRSDSSLFLTPVVILGITWWTWFTAFRVFGATLRRLVLSFGNALAGTHSLADYLSKAQQAELHLSRVLSLVVYTYGLTILYLGLAGLVIIWTFVQVVIRRRWVPAHLLALSSFIVIFTALAVLSLFRDVVTASPLRISNFAVASVPVLVGALFYDFLSDHQAVGTAIARKHLFRKILLVVLVSASILGVFVAYYSPLIGQPNHQFSYAQQAGIAFLVEKAATDGKNIYTPFEGAFTLSSVLGSEDLRELRQESPRWWIKAAPAHFGYEPDELGIEFENPGYLWVTAHENAYYTEVWPEGGRFTPQDFERLEIDPDWHRIYTSGDLTIWRRYNDE
jgi:hypothetical protein